MKTHRLEHRHDRRKEEICDGYLQPNTYLNILMKTHHLEHRNNRRKEEICGGYLQANTSNNSMKTHHLKHIHDIIVKEKRNMWWLLTS